MYWESGGAGSLRRLPTPLLTHPKCPVFFSCCLPQFPGAQSALFPWEISAFTCAATWTCESLPTQQEQHSLLSLHFWQCCLVPTSSPLPMDPAWIQTPGKRPPPWVRWTKLGPCPLLTVAKLSGLHLAVRDFFFFNKPFQCACVLFEGSKHSTLDFCFYSRDQLAKYSICSI